MDGKTRSIFSGDIRNWTLTHSSRIETLLEEAYNERMHLLTFLKLAEPGWMMRLSVLGSQCIFFSAFFLAYLVSPRICHRFVGYLEEEAVITYTKAIKDLEDGHLFQWRHLEAPALATKYWQMPVGKRSMRHLLLYVRADEAKHRDVNHTLGSLDQDRDRNPFSAKFRAQVEKAGEVIDSGKGPNALYTDNQARKSTGNKA